MKYTDKEYYIEKLLVQKLDAMVDRVVNHKFDNLIIIDGKEGYGKSNLAAGISYYLAWKSNRKFSLNNVFFQIEDMLKYATSTDKQVIWWDEAALGALASESYSKVQRKLLQLLMVARKKQHFYIFVIPKFFKLKGDIIDRAIALIHTYSRDDVTRGRYAYYLNESKEKLYDFWTKTKDRGYTKFYDFTGTFSETLPLILDEKEYDKKKDQAILSLGDSNNVDSETAKLKAEIIELKKNLTTLPLTQIQLAKHLKISPSTLHRWKKLDNYKLKKDETSVSEGEDE